MPNHVTPSKRLLPSLPPEVFFDKRVCVQDLTHCPFVLLREPGRRILLWESQRCSNPPEGPSYIGVPKLVLGGGKMILISEGGFSPSPDSPADVSTKATAAPLFTRSLHLASGVRSAVPLGKVSVSSQIFLFSSNPPWSFLLRRASNLLRSSKMSTRDDEQTLHNLQDYSIASAPFSAPDFPLYPSTIDHPILSFFGRAEPP